MHRELRTAKPIVRVGIIKFCFFSLKTESVKNIYLNKPKSVYLNNHKYFYQHLKKI